MYIINVKREYESRESWPRPFSGGLSSKEIIVRSGIRVDIRITIKLFYWTMLQCYFLNVSVDEKEQRICFICFKCDHLKKGKSIAGQIIEIFVAISRKVKMATLLVSLDQWKYNSIKQWNVHRLSEFKVLLDFDCSCSVL